MISYDMLLCDITMLFSVVIRAEARRKDKLEIPTLDESSNPKPTWLRMTLHDSLEILSVLRKLKS